MIKLSELVKCKCPICGSNKTSTKIFQKDDNKYSIINDVYFLLEKKLKLKQFVYFVVISKQILYHLSLLKII